MWAEPKAEASDSGVAALRGNLQLQEEQNRRLDYRVNYEHVVIVILLGEGHHLYLLLVCSS